MAADLGDLTAFVAVARAGGFRDAARISGGSASSMSEAVRRLEQDMVAIPIGPREQRFATAASPAYLDRRGRPQHPRELLEHTCLRGRFASGAMTAWEFECDGEIVKLEPTGPLIVRIGAATDLAVDAAVAGSGVIHLFEDWLRPYFDRGELEPVLEPWWQRFSGPFSTIRAVGIFRRRCARSWISSARRGCLTRRCPSTLCVRNANPCLSAARG